ncbi:MAG: ABC transporter permease [Microbacterium gubbeenense]
MNAVKRFFDSTAFLGLVQYRVIVILVATFALSASMVPGFLEARTLSLSLDRVATLGIVAVGLTVVLIAGQLDLSVGTILALSGITTISLQPALGVFGAAVAGLIVGIVAGAVNGLLVVVLKVNSLVATLASMLMFRAVCHMLTGSRPVSGDSPLVGLAVTRPIGGTVSLRTLIFFAAIVLLALWLTRTVAGRNLFAVGSSPASATASGVRSNGHLFGVFVFSGAMAGGAGILQSLAVNTGSPVFGDTTALTAIAAVVIGGTRLEGGRGSAWGTLGGLLVMAFLTTSMEYQSVPAYIQDIVTGVILLLLILLDRFVSGKARRAEPLSVVLRRWSQRRFLNQKHNTATEEGTHQR